jgi:putative tryptophan/tyrosine transport system substrate-binding protein
VIDRRVFLCGITLGTLAAPLAVEAQPAGNVYRVGYLSAGSIAATPHNLEAFRQGLHELGWIEGRNIIIE